MSGLIFKVTHRKAAWPSSHCEDCGASHSEQSELRCPGPEPLEGTLTKAIFDEVKALQDRDILCNCGGSSLRHMSHSHWCSSKYRDYKSDFDPSEYD